jgi:hypothetical protein
MNKTEALSLELIHRKLDASQEAVEAALIMIYERQTAEERLGRFSVQTNGVGFSKFDAEFCTSLVDQLKRGRRLTPKQLAIARKKMKRYWRQLITTMTTTLPEPLVDDAPEPKAAGPVMGALPIPREVAEAAARDYASW